MRQIALSALLLASTLSAQEPPPDLSEVWQQTLDSLSKTSEPVERLRLLDTFVRREDAKKAPAHSAVLTAHYNLGQEHLQLMRVTLAEPAFRHVLEHAQADDRERRSAASFGLAQGYEIAGLTDRARRAYEQIVEQNLGLPAADWAKLGLARLDGGSPQIGKKLSGFRSRIDSGGTTRRLEELRGEPALLLFTDAKVDDELSRSLEAAFTKNKYDRARVWEFRRGTLKDTPLRPTFPCPNGFLDPTWMRYRVQESPTWLLVGPDGTLLGRNLPPSRLEKILQLFRERQ